MPNVDIPAHRYIGAAAGCWNLYTNEMLVKEYSDPAYYPTHRLSVDAYTAQHPGEPGPQQINSVAVHLIRMYLIFEKGYDARFGRTIIQWAATQKGRYYWLEPPGPPWEVNILDIVGAGDA